MSMANVYQTPAKPRIGYYLEHHYGGPLYRIRHISKKTNLVTAVFGTDCVLKIPKKHVNEYFIVKANSNPHL